MLFSIRKNNYAATAVIAVLISSCTAQADFSVSNTFKTMDEHPYLTSLGIFGATAAACGTYAYRTANTAKTTKKSMRKMELQARAIVAQWHEQNPNAETAIETPEYRSAAAFLSLDADGKLQAYEVGLKVSSTLRGIGAGMIATGTYLFGRKAIPFVASFFSKKEDTAATAPALSSATEINPGIQATSSTVSAQTGSSAKSPVIVIDKTEEKMRAAAEQSKEIDAELLHEMFSFNS